MNADCKPDVLFQFAILGSLFAENIYNIKKPKVGLLNIGEEKGKGNLLTQATYQLLEDNDDINFIEMLREGIFLMIKQMLLSVMALQEM